MPPRGGFVRDPASYPSFPIPGSSATPASESQSRTAEEPPRPPSPSKASRPLTSVQERRLIDFVRLLAPPSADYITLTVIASQLDERFLAVSRQVKRRNAHSSNIANVPALVEQLRPLFGVILSIPPFSASAALRSSYLLRLTGDVSEGSSIFGVSDVQFVTVADFLDLLDRGWHCCLSGHVWDHTRLQGVPVPVEMSLDGDMAPPSAPRGVPATDRVRLSSLLLNLRDSFRQALALPAGTSGPSRPTPSLTSDAASDAASDAGSTVSTLRESSVATGDGAAAMDMVLDPDADDSDEEDLGVSGPTLADDATAGELEEAIERLFSRSLALLNEL